MTAIRTSPSAGPRSAEITGFYEKDTGSIQYLAACPSTGKAAIIDAVLNFDPRSARTWTDSADQIVKFAHDKGYEIEWILDTHPHADHLMASAYLKDKLGAPACIGAKVREIAGIWGELYGAPEMFDPGRDFDRLLENGESFRIGELDVQVMLSPGHTLGSITYVVGDDAAFVHDTLMQADVGSSRADFPGGSAAELWDSIQRILSLPEATRLFIGHDYGAEGREGPAWEATVAEHLAANPHVHRGMKREDFIALRETRDAGLPLPDRMLHALQVNLRGGRLPDPDDKGRSFFRIPANRF